MEKIQTGDNPVVCQKWEESERGWGTRPDGFSLHVSREALQNYIREVYAPRQNTEYIPDEYERVDGAPYIVDVSDEVYASLVSSGGSRRYFRHMYATPEGSVDGWMPMDSKKRNSEE